VRVRACACVCVRVRACACPVGSTARVVRAHYVSVPLRMLHYFEDSDLCLCLCSELFVAQLKAREHPQNHQCAWAILNPSRQRLYDRPLDYGSLFHYWRKHLPENAA